MPWPLAVYGLLEVVLCATAVIWLAYLVTVFVLDRLVARQIQSHCHPQLGGVSPVRRAFPRTEQFVSTADDPQARLSPPFRGIGRPAEGFARFFSKVPFRSFKFPNCNRWNSGSGDRHRVKVRSDRRFPVPLNVPSAARVAAGAFGFLIFIHALDGPER
jgi:hypothetical protein